MEKYGVGTFTDTAKKIKDFMLKVRTFTVELKRLNI